MVQVINNEFVKVSFHSIILHLQSRLGMNVFQPRVAKKCRFPIPIQFIVLVIGTLLSYLFEFSENYGVEVTGPLTPGIPVPKPPSKELMGALYKDSIVVALVGYSVTLSLAKTFAQRFHYDMDGNQELLAEVNIHIYTNYLLSETMYLQSLSNIFGSFFHCLPASASISRSSVQVGVGGRTLVTSAISMCLLIVIILTAWGFEALPKAILAAIIVVALKSMLLQVYDLPKFYKRDKLDGALWIFTFIATVLMDIDLGLYAGTGANLILLVYRSYATTLEEVGPIHGFLTVVDMNYRIFSYSN